MQIRRANRDDIGFISEFQRAMAMETEGMKLDSDVLRNGVKAVFNGPERGFYVVAEENNSIIASTMITPEWSDWRNGWFWWIQSVYVIPTYRRKGVFSKIYDFVKTESGKSKNIQGLRLYVEKNNKAAIKTYEKIGMSSDHYDFYEEIYP